MAAVRESTIGGESAVVLINDGDGRDMRALGVALLDASGNQVNPAAPVIGASENHIGQVGSPADVIAVTPVVEVTALDAGDVVFDTTAITNAARVSGGVVRLDTIDVIDVADQKAQLRLIFFSANRSLGTIDGAPNINDTNILDYVGQYEILAADYVDLGGASVATYRNVGLMMKAVGGRDLYVAAFTTGTPTYGSASALKFLFGFAQG